MKICVNCRPGPRGEEEPSAFHLGGARLPVLTILERWLQPTHRYYRVAVHDGRSFVLRHEAARGVWELAAVERPRR